MIQTVRYAKARLVRFEANKVHSYTGAYISRAGVYGKGK